VSVITHPVAISVEEQITETLGIIDISGQIGRVKSTFGIVFDFIISEVLARIVKLLQEIRR